MNWFQRQSEKQVPAKDAPDARALRGDGDAIANSVASFLTKTGLFDRDAYTRANPEVLKSGLEPLHHFIRVGIHAGRSFTSLEAIARLWREVLRDPSEPPLPNIPISNFRAAIYVSSRGNFFMREIAQVLHAGFADAGVDAPIIDDRGAPRSDATHHIVIAPHEFFTLGDGKKWAHEDFISSAIMFSTEQIQTQWFARSLVFLLRAKAVADINLQNAAILRKGGVNAITIEPGYSPSFEPFEHAPSVPAALAAGLTKSARQPHTGEDNYPSRPVDLVFLGQHSPRREKFLALYAPKFAELNCAIYYTRAFRPLEPGTSPAASSSATAALLQRAKVSLNLHRDEYIYFEWWRLMQAFWNKSVVVTEPCFPHPIFKPGEHFFEESPRHIHHLVDWLVRSPDGQAAADAMRARAWFALSTEATAKGAALSLLKFGASL